ncbi:hypothetical protein HID58_040480 [Brassica napus]|uniref:Uncharacterized protein n=1 Tax=Brassica napus TaxID=3708 RepID=A0ABQ8B868_BRANA|nr:hypothetical protein HID58_040480 [Brassica napus]
MPLFVPSIPPGFAPPAGLIAPEVFEQIQLYMNCIDPEERRIREANVDVAPETVESFSHTELQRRHSNNRSLLAIEMEQGPVSETRFNISHMSGMMNDRSLVSQLRLGTMVGAEVRRGNGLHGRVEESVMRRVAKRRCQRM